MRKQALRAVTMLISIIALAFVTAVASNAQTGGKRIKADIPFDFVVGNKTLAAGKYSVGRIASNPDGLLVRSRDGRHSAIRLANVLQANAPKKTTTLTFLRYGDTYYLAQVWISGSAEGREILKSKSERSVTRELARSSSDGKAEVVTIIADVE